MKQIIVMYGAPKDTDHFDRYYRDVHVPLVRKMPHLRDFKFSTGEVQSSNGDFVPHLVATLDFDNDDELARSLNSEEGKLVVADVANFASGGVTILTITI